MPSFNLTNIVTYVIRKTLQLPLPSLVMIMRVVEPGDPVVDRVDAGLAPVRLAAAAPARGGAGRVAQVVLVRPDDQHAPPAPRQDELHWKS